MTETGMSTPRRGKGQGGGTLVKVQPAPGSLGAAGPVRWDRRASQVAPIQAPKGGFL